MRHYLLILTLCSICFSGCYTYKIFPADSRHFSYDGPKKKAYVINPELKKEYAILMKSKIFDMTNDSLDTTAIKIKLFPLEKNLACGQGAIVTMISLGQLPVLMPDRYKYLFQEIYPNDSQFRSYDLTIATRYWFWDVFSLKKDFAGKAGQLLSSKYFLTGKTPANKQLANGQ